MIVPNQTLSVEFHQHIPPPILLLSSLSGGGISWWFAIIQVLTTVINHKNPWRKHLKYDDNFSCGKLLGHRKCGPDVQKISPAALCTRGKQKVHEPYALWGKNKLKQLSYGEIWTSNQRTLIPPGNGGGWFAKTFPISSKSRKMFSHKELKFSLFSYILRERFRCFKWSKTVKFPGGFAPGPPKPHWKFRIMYDNYCYFQS